MYREVKQSIIYMMMIIIEFTISQILKEKEHLFIRIQETVFFLMFFIDKDTQAVC